MKSGHDRDKILEAMRKRLPVIHNGIHYDRIIEYVSWYDNNGTLRQSVVLLQKRSSIRVLADEVVVLEPESHIPRQ